MCETVKECSFLNLPFVVFLELSWYESHRIGASPGQFWSQDLEPALGHLNNLRHNKSLCKLYSSQHHLNSKHMIMNVHVSEDQNKLFSPPFAPD